jgi:hypothetical protein
MTSIDNMMKSKLQNYNLAKGSLVQMQRKKKYVVVGIDQEDDLIQIFAAVISP